MRRTMLVTVAALGLVLGLGATAQATPRSTATPTAAAVHAEQGGTQGAAAERAAEVRAAEVRGQQEQVRALMPYVSGTAGAVRFDRAGALAAGRDATVVAQFAAGLDLAQSSTTTRTSGAQLAAACPGLTYGPYYRPFYFTMWLDACDARAIAAVASAGGSVATIAGTIVAVTGVGAPAGAIVAIAGGVATLGGAVLQYCNRYGRGVVVRSYGYCSSQ